MVRTADDICSLYRIRADRLAPRHARMRDISDVYNGRVELPLPELSKKDRAAVPNLTRQGTDQMARRVASVDPNITVPPLRPGIKLSEDKADKRRQILYGWREQSKGRKVRTRRARWFITYASAPAIVRPDPITKSPMWEPVSPFDMFPAATRLDSYTPDDVIVRHRKTRRWIADYAPDAIKDLSGNKNPDTIYEVLEYISAEEIVFCVVGQKDDMAFSGSEAKNIELRRLDNRAGICWGVIPEQVSLDEPAGQFDEIIGMYVTQAALMAMQVLAVKKGIWPQTFLVNPNTGAIPNMISRPDPETGEPGIVVNGIIDRQNIDPTMRVQDAIDRLEYSQRQTAALPAEIGGSGSQNVRTGRRGSQIMSASIDFTIAEAQDALAEAEHEENIRAIAIDKGYYNFSKSMYVSTKGARGKVDYTPSDIWETDQHVVRYPIAGTDLSDLVINGGQRVGMGTMSKLSFMEIDPLVDDAEAEQQRVRWEALETAGLTAIQTLAQNPDGPMQLPDLTRIARKMFADNKSWYEAVDEVQKDKQQEQAQGAPPGSPETQPGLAMPGQGAEIPTVGGLGPSMAELTQLLNQLGSADTALARR